MPSNTFKGMKRVALLAVVGTTLVLLAGNAGADLRTGKEKLLRGDYKAAISDLERVKGKDRPEARVLLARTYLRLGDYEAAEKVATKLTASKNASVEAEGHVLRAEIYRATGRYTEARREVEPLSAKGHLRARWMLGLIYYDLGQRDRTKSLFESIMDDWDAGSIDQGKPENAFYAAEAGRWSQHYEWANDGYREAVHLDSSYLEANVEWGNMLLEKYAIGEAEKSFDEVLKIDPHHPDAHVGMAKVKLEQSYDLAAASHHLEQALEVNPHNVGALLVRAGIQIDQNLWDGAKATLADVFKVNPLCFEGHALLATVHWLRDDKAAYATEKKAVFSANPQYAEFYHIIARSAVREHRYKEAIELEKEAVAVNPEYFEAMQAIGTGYLRLGEEELGLKWLRDSWKGDEYNVRTYNTLNLFDDELPKEYSFSKSKYFKFRYHNDEQAILSRYIEPVLTRAFEDMVKRYKFRPKTPVTIELYQDPQQYSVRTVGVPNLGALGVCFGQVITAMSPTTGNINWGMVLWHELAHVFAIQISNSRVPRWYTEGLSEYETLIARPEWRRENDVDIWAAMEEGSLPSVAELNQSFMKPDMQEVVVAYHLASVVIEYIAKTYGFDRVVEGLTLFAKNMETPEVIEKITGLTVAEFDTAFYEFLQKRLAPYKGTFRVPTTGANDVKKLAVEAAAAPKSADAQARLALGHFYDGNAIGAQNAADAALALDQKNKIALYVSAELALRRRELDTAKQLYTELIAAGGDGFDIRGRLGMIAKSDGDVAEAEKQLCAAKKLDPERSYPYMELAELYEQSGRMDEALEELETYVMIEQMQYPPLKKLVGAYSARKAWAKVITYGEMAVNINPSDAELFLDLARAYRENGDSDKALFTYESALLARPELRRPALAHIGMAHVLAAQKQRRRALKEVKKALATEPANAEALALRKQLRKHR